VPRLLLVPEAVPPPQVADDEDWLRLPADERDVAIRAANLCLRCGSERSAASGPAAAAVAALALSPPEALVFERLVELWPAVVARADLAEALWPAGPPSARALDDLVYRLRRRLRGAGLEVVASRGRGLTLQPAPLVPAGPSDGAAGAAPAPLAAEGGAP
jgi:DNA-binding response OmpR family regulator